MGEPAAKTTDGAINALNELQYIWKAIENGGEHGIVDIYQAGEDALDECAYLIIQIKAEILRIGDLQYED